MKTSDLMNAINGQDPALIAASAPGAGRKRARTLRILLIAAVALLAAALTVVAVFASKAPEPETPVVAVTTEETKEDEKTPVTETPVETKETEVVPTETAVEPTPTEMSDPTPIPAETTVETTASTENSVVISKKLDPLSDEISQGLDQTVVNASNWRNLAKKPIAILRILEITDQTKTFYAPTTIDTPRDKPFTLVQVEVLDAVGVVKLSGSGAAKQYVPFVNALRSLNRVYLHSDLIANLHEDDIVFASFQGKYYGSEGYFYSFNRKDSDRMFCKALGKSKASGSALYIDDYSFSEYNYKLTSIHEKLDDDYIYDKKYNVLFESIPAYGIDHQTSAEEIAEILHWFEVLYRLDQMHRIAKELNDLGLTSEAKKLDEKSTLSYEEIDEFEAIIAAKRNELLNEQAEIDAARFDELTEIIEQLRIDKAKY